MINVLLPAASVAQNSYEEEEHDWDVVKQSVANNKAVVSKEKNSTRSSSTSQSSPPPPSSSSSSSSSSAVTKLSASQKKECGELYNNIDDDKKWVLSTQTIVEDQIYKHAMKCDYHHSPSHSITMESQDNCWTEYFSTEEFQETKDHMKVVLDDLPRFTLGSKKNYGSLDLYFYKYLPVGDHTEADLIHRVWHFIEKCYDESKIVVRSRGEKVSNRS
ncbi:hypothetical protein BDA99DRAFT_556040 [Phascolomyces articulosus]|uniref:Uncharacterized protein n=1 Tax=Phascolomyces articulosus TaxID=60185 RepID=A0AAD5KLE7_9FUNG|nr:hypothetical protein BDA99DRAFT_556040 [Phascolomyces articulosus]